MTTNIRFPQGPIADATGYITLEWQQWFQNPQFVSITFPTVIDVTSGGTGIASGTPGGVLAFNSATSIVSSGVLGANKIVLGGGSGVAPSTPLGLGTTTTVLHGNAAGAPTFGAVVLTTDVSGTLPVANGGTAVTSASANTLFAGPTSGGASTPAFRTLVAADLPVSTFTNSIAADVNLSNVANYFDGPSVAQGTAGIWSVSGTVTVNDSVTANATFFAKLWDGTTVIASTAFGGNSTATGQITLSLSGVITSPAGNLRISVRDISSTSGKILANTTGNAKDSTITATRIG